MITKEKAQHICDKSQYGEASLSELIALNLRVLYCKDTRQYVHRNCRLTTVMKSTKIVTLSSADKAAMDSAFQKALQQQ